MLISSLFVALAAPAFTKTATYVDESGATVGERWVHRRGATLDLFERDTAPQAAIRLPTHPVDDRGASHALEHLLSQRGAPAMAVTDSEALWGVRRSAFTHREYTAYLFRAAHSTSGFYEHLDVWLEALFEPQFDEDDLHAEIIHPAGEEASGRMFLELDRGYWGKRERGASIERLVYGEDHPLGHFSGGKPNEIHQLSIDDIGKFHRATYTQDNLSLIVVLPDTSAALEEIHDILRGLPRRRSTQAPLPPPKPAPQNTSFITDGEGWLPRHHLIVPPRPDRDNRQRLLLQSLLELEETYSPDEVEVLGTEVVFWGKGTPNLALDPPPPSILAIASLPPDSEELAAWRIKALSKVDRSRRDAQEIGRGAPNLGGSGVQRQFIELLRNVAASDEPVRSLTQTEDHAWLADKLGQIEANPWAELIDSESLADLQVVMESAAPAERVFQPGPPPATKWSPAPAELDGELYEQALANAPMERDPTLQSTGHTLSGVAVEVLRDAPRTDAEVRFIFDLRGIPGAQVEWTGLVVELWKGSLDDAFVRTSISSATGRAEIMVRARGEDQLKTMLDGGWRPKPEWTADQLLDEVQALLEKRPKKLLSPLADLRAAQDPRLLHTRSRTVKRFDLLRLKWRLTPSIPGMIEAVKGWTADGPALADASVDADLRWLYAELPDATATHDMAVLTDLAATELATDPQSAVKELHLVLDTLATRENVRATVLASEPKAVLVRVEHALSEMPVGAPGVEPAAPKRLSPQSGAPPRHAIVPSKTRSRFRFEAHADASDEDWIGIGAAGGHAEESLYGAIRHSGIAYGTTLEIDPLQGEMMWKASRCADLMETVQQGLAVAEHPVSKGAWQSAITRQMTTRRHEDLVDRLQFRASARKEGLGPDVQRAMRERWRAAATAVPHDRSLMKALIPSGPKGQMYSYVQTSPEELEAWTAYLLEVGQPAPVEITKRDLWIWDANTNEGDR